MNDKWYGRIGWALTLPTIAASIASVVIGQGIIKSGQSGVSYGTVYRLGLFVILGVAIVLIGLEMDGNRISNLLARWRK